MSLNPDIRDQAYQFFIEEAQELLQILETGLLELRQDHSTPKVHELMRAAHSIKGGAASVELGAIELLAHRLEDFFKALYSDRVEFDAELESLLLRGYDCLSNPLTEQIEAGTFDEEAALLTAEPVFAALENRLADALKNADSYIPSSNDLGVDIVASIFEVDVAQALEHLSAVAANPANFSPAEELQGTLEMFAGFAELFNLPGFSEIVQTAQAALTQNPQQAVEIIKATVADCTIAQDRVLAGDRSEGGSVSSTLAALAQAEDLVNTESDLVLPENLWSQMPVDEPSGEIFAIPLPEEVTENSHTVLETDVSESENLWSQMPVDEPLAEDIFANLNENNSTQPKEAESQIEDLEQILGQVDDEAATFSQDSIWSELPPVEPLAEDIFAAPEAEASAYSEEIFEPAAQESIASESSEAEPIDDIEQVFGVIPAEAESIAEDANQVWSTNPNDEAESEDSDNEPTANQSGVAPPDNLTAAIASIENIFARLTHETPLAAPPQVTTVNQPAQTTTSPSPISSSNPKKASPKLSVRVDLERLERMNNLVGELTINRNSLALQNNQLQENVSGLSQKFLRFRGVTKKLREISDQMLLEQRSPYQSDSKPMPRQSLSSDAISSPEEFDSLEMDSYNLLYASLQEVLEEIVQLEENVEDITIFAQQSDRTINTQRQMLNQMRDELMWVRMLPLEQILQRFPRILRELSHKHQKPVELKLNGTGVLVDKAVLEKLSDPLLHLLRNGFDHGIEEPTIRSERGKPPTGLIEINAYYQGNQTVIEVKDDGKGLDLAKITQKGLEKGLISSQEAASASKERIFELIFEPGFSTASKVSELSGRGVGMNIVRSQIETLKGRISVDSTPGKGSIFTMRLPLTLTIAKLLVCSLGSTAFAIPSDSIEEIVIPTMEQIKLANQQRFLAFANRLVPIYSLTEVLNYNCPILDTDSNHTTFKTIAAPEDWLAPLLLLRRGQQMFALEIANLLSEQELVIKPYGKAISAPGYSYGCTILSDGSLIPVFDGVALLGTILGAETKSTTTSNFTSGISESEVEPTSETIASENLLPNSSSDRQNIWVNSTPPVKDGACVHFVKTIMVVDDSTALRRTMALTLENEGYRVIQKKDGKEALNGFKHNPNLDLIICDVEMPVMNGFEFLGMRRRDSALSKVPTFMLTSRSGAKHRNLAKQLGADGYFTKPYVEQDFVQEVNKILRNSDNSTAQNRQNAMSPPTSASAIALKTKTILIIDDSSALRRTLALSLEQRGYRVLQGRDGSEGLEQLRNNLQTDLVICDIEMPNVNGFEFLTARRQEPQLANIPVVMLTSRSTNKHRTLASSLGAVGFFTKPYVEQQFIPEIEKYINQ